MNDAAPTPIAVYSPTYRVSASAFEALKYWGRTFWKDRWQIWTQFLRNFKSNINETALGFAWSVILPLVPVSVYSTLALMRAFPVVGHMPHVLYICIGLSVYSLATGPIQDTMSAVQGEAAVLSKSDVSFLTPILSRFGQLVWDTLIRAVVIAAMILLFGISPGWGVLWLPLALIPVLVLALSIGVLAAILNIVAKDVANIVAIVIRYGLFFSSVLFPMPLTGRLANSIMMFNPFATYVIEIRNLIVFGHMENPALFCITAGVTMIVFLIALTILYRAEPRLRMALA